MVAILNVLGEHSLAPSVSPITQLPILSVSLPVNRT